MERYQSASMPARRSFMVRPRPHLLVAFYWPTIVSRPLFIEEHGLRLLLDQEGTGLELAREAYEAGDWAAAVSEAFVKGKKAKDAKRLDMTHGVGVDRREEEGRKLAGTVTDWVTEWWTD